MNAEVWTKLGEAFRVFNSPGEASVILMVEDREQPTGSIRIHTCKHDLLKLVEQIQILCVDSTKEKSK
jgi:hypothetical protein